MIEILLQPQIQIGILAIIVLALLLNFIIKVYLIKAGIYKRVYKQRRIDWDKFKGGVWLIGICGLLIAAFKYSWGFGITFLALGIFIGLTQILSALFLSNKSWKNYKYWD